MEERFGRFVLHMRKYRICKINLQEDLVGNIDLLSILAKLGILIEQHLDDLRLLQHDDLMKFFADVVYDQISLLDKLQFIRSLRAESSNIRVLHSAFIPCPPLDTERRLSEPYHLDKGIVSKLEDGEFQELAVRSVCVT